MSRASRFSYQDVRLRSALALVALLAATGAVACRSVLGIDDDRPSLSDEVDAGDAQTADSSPGHAGFCAVATPAPQYCADFEDGDVFAGWDNAGKVPDPGATGGGTLEELLEPGGRKVLARVPALVGTGKHASALLLYTLPVMPPRISLHAALNVLTEDIPASESLIVMSIVFGDEGAVIVYRDHDGAAVAVVPDGKAARFPSWPPGVEHTIGLVIATGVHPFARASLDDSWSPELELPAHFASAARPRVAVGLSADPPMGEARMSIDNALLYWGAAE